MAAHADEARSRHQRLHHGPPCIKCATLAGASASDGTSALGSALAIAACLLPTAVVGGWLGASLNLRITGNAVRWVLVAWLPAAATWMAWPVVAGWLAGPR
jgi:uncharacterized membrane protein YfcA